MSLISSHVHFDGCFKEHCKSWAILIHLHSCLTKVRDWEADKPRSFQKLKLFPQPEGLCPWHTKGGQGWRSSSVRVWKDCHSCPTLHIWKQWILLWRCHILFDLREEGKRDWYRFSDSLGLSYGDLPRRSIQKELELLTAYMCVCACKKRGREKEQVKICITTKGSSNTLPGPSLGSSIVGVCLPVCSNPFIPCQKGVLLSKVTPDFQGQCCEVVPT